MTTPSSELYRELPLTKGQVVIVDASDYEWFNQWKWSAMWNAHTHSFVACRGINNKGKSKKFLMHREIMVLTFGDGRMVDHINHDTLDNRRENLRIVNNSQNQRNRRNRSDNKSGFKGVSYCRGRNKWQAHIYMNGKSVSLGRFTTPEAAYEAYCFAAQEHYGEYACMP